MKFINKTAGSPEYTGVEKGQGNIDGIKEVHIDLKLVQDKSTGKWKVKVHKRIDSIKDTKEKALEAYKTEEQDANEIKTFEELKEEDKTKKTKEDDAIEKKESSYEVPFEPLCVCAKCGTSVYPPSTYSMDAWFNKEVPADAYCPCCGYGLSGKNNLNEQSLDSLIEGYSE